MQDYSSLFVILMGLGTVFFGLICLVLLTNLMGMFLNTPKKGTALDARSGGEALSSKAGGKASSSRTGGQSLALNGAAKTQVLNMAGQVSSVPGSAIDLKTTDHQMVAAVSAAIAEELGTDVKGIKIVSFKLK